MQSSANTLLSLPESVDGLTQPPGSSHKPPLVWAKLLFACGTIWKKLNYGTSKTVRFANRYRYATAQLRHDFYFRTMVMKNKNAAPLGLSKNHNKFEGL